METNYHMYVLYILATIIWDVIHLFGKNIWDVIHLFSKNIWDKIYLFTYQHFIFRNCFIKLSYRQKLNLL